MNLYYIRCSVVTNNKSIEKKCELDGKTIFILTVFIDCIINILQPLMKCS